MTSERLKTRVEESTLFVFTQLVGELEHLKTETRLIDEMYTPSMLRLTRKAETLVRVLPTLARNYGDRDERRKWKSPRFDCAR